MAGYEERRKKLLGGSVDNVSPDASILSGDQVLRMQKGAGIDPLETIKDKDVYIRGRDANITKLNQPTSIGENQDANLMMDNLPSMIKSKFPMSGDGKYTMEDVQKYLANQPKEEFDPTKNDEDPRNYSKLMNLMKK